MYVAVSELRSYLGTTGQTEDAVLEESIEAAQDEIEHLCRGRRFEGSTGTRYYRSGDIISLEHNGLSGSVLWLGKDLLSISTLTNGDETAISSTGYWLEPRNSTTCYQYIRLRTSESWIFNTDGEVSIAGTWGYSTAPPPAMKNLTKEWASYLYRMRDNPVYDVVATPELGTITVPKGFPVHALKVLTKGGFVRTFGVY